MPLTFNAFFLGNTAIRIDPTEGNQVAENANLLVGATYGGVQNSLVNGIVSFTAQNVGGTAAALDMNNNLANDIARTNATGSLVNYTFDGTSIYNATITYTDGTSSAMVPLVIVQMTNGDLYAVPSPTAGTATNAALTAGSIRSVTLNSLVGNTYSGMADNRPLLTFPTCFARGTRIATELGEVAVQLLRVGDRVQTLDNGASRVRWVGSRSYTGADLATDAGLRPIRIAAGALGQGLPLRDLVVSPQHRILARSRVAERMFGVGEVMVAAKHLVGLPGIEGLVAETGVEYWHFLLDQHSVVFSEGACTESLYTGPQAMATLTHAQRVEIFHIFPELADGRIAALTPAVRPLVRGGQGRRMTERLVRNHQDLLT